MSGYRCFVLVTPERITGYRHFMSMDTERSTGQTCLVVG